MAISKVFNFAKNYYIASTSQEVSIPRKLSQILERWRINRGAPGVVNECSTTKVELVQKSESEELKRLFVRKSVWDGTPLVIKYSGKSLDPIKVFGTRELILPRKKTPVDPPVK